MNFSLMYQTNNLPYTLFILKVLYLQKDETGLTTVKLQ